MGKKKELKFEGKLLDRLWDCIEAQEWTLKQIISMFYPGGTFTEFTEASQIWDALKDSPSFSWLSEDEQSQIKYRKIADDSGKKESTSSQINFFCNHFWFQDIACMEYNAYIMFKAEQDGPSIYLYEQDEFIDDDGPFPIFLIDGDEKEAFLVIDRITRGEDFGYDSSYLSLSELHAIITGGKFYDEHNHTVEPVDFMVSFSRAEGKYIVERIFDYNKRLVELFSKSVKSNSGV